MNPEHLDTTEPTELWWWTALSLVVLSLSAYSAKIGFVAAAIVLLLAGPIMVLRHQRNQRSLRAQIERSDTSLRGTTARTELLADLIDSADIPIVATDADGCVVHINRRGRTVLGISNAMLGRAFDELMTQDSLHKLEALARALEPGHAHLSIPIDGEMHEFDVSADPVEHSGGAVLTFRDITELSRAMTLKADFVANASHELRTPIASIKGAAETLSGPARSDPQMSDRLIGMITSNAERLEQLAGDLLDLSKLEAENQPSQIEPVDLGSLVEMVLKEYAPLADRREIVLVNSIGGGLEHMLSDPMLLTLMLRNLIQNAIKFAHEHTKVRVVGRACEISPDRTATVPTALSRPRGVVLEVIDRGIGIPLAHQQRIFERFYQVDDARAGSGVTRGTGLGLAIVKHASKRLGGAVSIESVYQSGTTVRIELPGCVDAAPEV